MCSAARRGYGPGREGGRGGEAVPVQAGEGGRQASGGGTERRGGLPDFLRQRSQQVYASQRARQVIVADSRNSLRKDIQAAAKGGIELQAMATRVRSYSKINLGLAIGPVRADGFHGLVTLYQTLALHDVVTVEAGRRFAGSRFEGGADRGLR